MAANRAQARTIFRYVGALLRETPLLERLIVRELAESFELSNRVVIEIGTASFKSVRGYSFAGVLCDEIAFWQSDEGSTNPDEEVLAALRPGLVTLPGAMLLVRARRTLARARCGRRFSVGTARTMRRF
jgi:hypothetical protein